MFENVSNGAVSKDPPIANKRLTCPSAVYPVRSPSVPSPFVTAPSPPAALSVTSSGSLLCLTAGCCFPANHLATAVRCRSEDKKGDNFFRLRL